MLRFWMDLATSLPYESVAERWILRGFNGAVFPRDEVAEFLRSELEPTTSFSQLQIPTTVVAADQRTGRIAAFNQGALVPALLATVGATVWGIPILQAEPVGDATFKDPASTNAIFLDLAIKKANHVIVLNGATPDIAASAFDAALDLLSPLDPAERMQYLEQQALARSMHVLVLPIPVARRDPNPYDLYPEKVATEIGEGYAAAITALQQHLAVLRELPTARARPAQGLV